VIHNFNTHIDCLKYNLSITAPHGQYRDFKSITKSQARIRAANINNFSEVEKVSYVKKSTRAWGSPGRYIQGPGELMNLPQYTRLFGRKVYAIIDQFFYESLSAKLQARYQEDGAEIKTVIFNSEVTERQIEETTAAARSFAPEIIVGIGGGKTLDTAKAVADNFHTGVIIVPTAASTDAPTSALSVIYKDNGEHSHPRLYNKSPDIVLVDSEIIAQAPVRFLVSGMGDALSTIFEARANQRSDSPNYISGGFRQTKTAMAVAEACYKTLLSRGLHAKMAVENKSVTEALEDIIEVNILMSGLGFENTGCAGAHSVGDGVTGLPEGKKTFHGERVAFGVICQLVAENAPLELIEEVIQFNLSIGLPVTLADLYVEATPENLKTIAAVSMHSFWDAEPFLITEEKIIDILVTTDAMGKFYKEKMKQ
jgi:glycerol dehydrogenase